MSRAKFIVAIIGVIVIALKQFAGLDFGDDFMDKVSPIVIGILTAIGVERVPNK